MDLDLHLQPTWLGATVRHGQRPEPVGRQQIGAARRRRPAAPISSFGNAVSRRTGSAGREERHARFLGQLQAPALVAGDEGAVRRSSVTQTTAVCRVVAVERWHADGRGPGGRGEPRRMSGQHGFNIVEGINLNGRLSVFRPRTRTPTPRPLQRWSHVAAVRSMRVFRCTGALRTTSAADGVNDGSLHSRSTGALRNGRRWGSCHVALGAAASAPAADPYGTVVPADQAEAEALQ